MLVNLLDVSNQANFLLDNLKEIIEKMQAEKNYFKTQLEKLQIENQKLVVSNKKLVNKNSFLEEKLKTTNTLLVQVIFNLSPINLNNTQVIIF